MNTQVRRYAAELAAAPELHRILGLVTSCRDMVAAIDECPAYVLIGMDDAIQAIDAAIDRAIADAPADAADAWGDHVREQRETENA